MKNKNVEIDVKRIIVQEFFDGEADYERRAKRKALFKKEEIDYIDVAKRRLFLAWEQLDKKNRKYIKEQNLILEFMER